MTNFKQALRTAQPMVELASTTATEIAKEIDAQGVRLVHDKKQDEVRLHLVAKDESYVSIKVGSKVNLTEATDEARILELIDNYPVFYGETENGFWFTFAPKGNLVPTKTFSFADVIKGKRITTAPAK